MALIGVFDESHLTEVILDRVQSDDFSIGIDKEEFINASIDRKNSTLEFGYIECLKINEEI